MGKFKKNKVKCDIGSYIHYWRGLKKSGKTTLFYDLVKEQYGNLDNGLLISIGDEIGYQALDGLVYAECPTWDDLIETIDELVENKSENDFKIVCLDTADEMIKIAKEEVKRIHKKSKGVAAEFNACLGGYGAPRDKVVELVDEQLARIRKAGYGLIIIGHTKIRDIKEKNGDEYQQLTSNLNSDYDGIFANKADIVMTISIEKNIDENKHIDGTIRYMYFRSDGFVDAGGRFSQMPERVEYGAKNYIKAFEDGVKGAMSIPISDAEIEHRKEAEQEARNNAAKTFVEEETEKAEEEATMMKEASDRERLVETIREKYKNLPASEKKAFKQMMNETYGISQLADESNAISDLEALLAQLS